MKKNYLAINKQTKNQLITDNITKNYTRINNNILIVNSMLNWNMFRYNTCVYNIDNITESDTSFCDIGG